MGWTVRDSGLGWAQRVQVLQQEIEKVAPIGMPPVQWRVVRTKVLD